MLSKIISKLSWRHSEKWLSNFFYSKPVRIAGLLLLLSVIGYYSIMLSQETKLHPSPQNSEFVKQDGKIKISPATNLLQKITYTKCSDTELFRTKPPDNLIGLNYNQVQKIYAGWLIEKFDSNEVSMTLTVDSLCREHANNMFIGIKDGYVAVFHGVPGPKAMIKEITKIPVTGLMPQDIQELHQGLVIQSKEELLRTLEGMQAR